MQLQLTFARTHPPLSKIAVERLFLKVPTFSLCSFTWQNSAGTVSALAKIAVERHGFLVPWRILLRVERFFISELQGFNCISAPLLLWPSYIPLLCDTELQLFNLKKKKSRLPWVKSLCWFDLVRKSPFVVPHIALRHYGIGGESLIWVGYHNLGQLLAPKRIELENPAKSQI